MESFSKLYDSMDEYIRRRDPASYENKRIELEVKYFKIPNLVEVLPKEFKYSSVAEIGCATGELIGTFPGSDIKRRVGFDISSLNILSARKKFPQVTFYNNDFRLSAEKFDLVILSDILEHVEDDVEFLQAAAQMGKLLLVNLPLEKCLINLFRNYGFDDPSGHLRSYSLKDGLQLFENADLLTLKYLRKWSLESEYELFRQKLNEEIKGSRFSGNLLQQKIKVFIFLLTSHFHSLERFIFSSNLFASVCSKYQ
ncbi:MAG: class I SAM-dependent methyltransferase [Coleofasciculus sp. G1-WW12-02]|uniref:class I SAM-dependent methyltransferase n=1 Tax=Coleofasciculus sp. G1-WW12-02 TaxID=3068483 RepID=UPI0032FCDAA9